MRLGVFARLIIVLSVFWTIGGTLYFATDVTSDRANLANSRYEMCLLENQRRSPIDCAAEEQEFYDTYEAFEDHPLMVGLIISLIYLALALVVFIPAFYAFRWVLAGKSK